jgi:4-hydroxythreonine-4-phosphate dehydrogenase
MSTSAAIAPPALPAIAISMGDPAGIGPELCLRVLADPSVRQVCVPWVFGDASLLFRVADVCGLELPDEVLRPEDLPPAEFPLGPAIVDCGKIDSSAVHPGHVQAACGHAAFGYVTLAAEAVLAGRARALVTAPICKEALHAAGIEFPGHTELLAELTGASDVRMAFASEELIVSLVTIHEPLHRVPSLLTAEKVRQTIVMTVAMLEKLGIPRPRITVCGLNPHAGEHGLFGNEEQSAIAPAIAALADRGLDIAGPLPPDTAFLPAVRARTDAYVAMYHDQALIPFKMLAFDSGVNITLGLPIVRTSPDHGTAFDIAWKGMASPASMLKSVEWALRLAGA